MSAVQQEQRFHFGTAKLFAKDSTGRLYTYGQLNDITVDIKGELKEYFSEGNFPFAVADGHKSIDISAKHYLADLSNMALNLSQSAPTTNSVTYVEDEIVTVATHAYTLAKPTSPDIVALVMNVAGDNVVYQQVAAGSEAAGVSYSINTTTGVLTFAAGETATSGTVTYTYATGTGSVMAVNSTFQNSATPFSMTCIKRDRSPIDGSLGTWIWEFLAVRPGGIKAQYKEGDATLYEQMFKAYANPQGLVLNIRAQNT